MKALFPLPSRILHARFPPRVRFQQPSALLSTLSPGSIHHGEKGTQYRLIRPLKTPSRGNNNKPNIWLAVDDTKPHIEYIIKQPSKNDNSSALSAFNHELTMQKLFAKDPMIRSLVDYIPDSEPAGPMMVLEAFTDTLWDARNTRAFTIQEIKWIMKGVLLGVFTVHMKGLVHTVSNPSTRKITSLTYRSPEVHFQKPWNQSTDVWSWGIILAQLLQSRIDMHSPGIYDSIPTTTTKTLTETKPEKEHAIRDQLAIDFDLASVPFYADCGGLLPAPQPEEAYMWANTMVEMGVAGEDVQFLVEVLNPDPEARITVREILESGYLEG
ncbi:kinase-like protein [Aspergillus sclerotiicarbonarius CBS 121057]|uniref:Kinase-like protein n=1 Tax=Aspergillus sclerotiicarbonarius (strain CBS 121057 / IBT 28362) TaxID=1448318 RepID=A0A319EAQ9_ASPSB|nr:kinase-like protein [Aspergillus sclerotiicarbonarius CBS 121057]